MELLSKAQETLKALSAIMPPPSQPLLQLSYNFMTFTGQKGVMLLAQGKVGEATRYNSDTYRCAMLVMAGYQAGKGGLIFEGNSSRGVLLMMILSLTKKFVA